METFLTWIHVKLLIAYSLITSKVSDKTWNGETVFKSMPYGVMWLLPNLLKDGLWNTQRRVAIEWKKFSMGLKWPASETRF